MGVHILAGTSLLRVPCPSSLQRETATAVSTHMTLGGRRKALVRRGGRRVWSIDTSTASPTEVSTIETIARSGMQVGWYPAEAGIGNLFSPQASGFDVIPTGATDAGLVQLPDGSVARSIAVADGTAVSVGSAHGVYEGIPVTPGKPMSFGVWAFGGGRVGGFFRDANGMAKGTISIPAVAGDGWVWVAGTVTVPEGVVVASVTLNGSTAYARPSASWGSVPRDELGTGCPKAVIHSPSHSPVALWEGANWTDSAYQVTEVG